MLDAFAVICHGTDDVDEDASQCCGRPQKMRLVLFTLFASCT